MSLKHPLTDFGKRVRKKQIDLDLTQTELARMVSEHTGLNVDPSRLQKILNGIANSPKVTEALETLLDLK